MKKSILLIAVCLLFSKLSTSQDIKNVRFGIRFTPAINWMVPDNDKKIQKGGAVMKAGIGLVLEFKLASVVSLQTGLEYSGAGCKAKYGTDSAAYLYKDDAIVKATIANDMVKNADSTFFASGGTILFLKERKYNIGYLNIPLTFKLKTKDIGGFTYFGQIGGNLFIRTSTRGNNSYTVYQEKLGVPIISKDIVKDSKVDVSKSVNLFSACGSFGAGAEYNISGSTSAYASLHYQYHFMNTTKADSGYLIRFKDGKASEFPNTMKLRQIVLAIGILF